MTQNKRSVFSLSNSEYRIESIDRVTDFGKPEQLFERKVDCDLLLSLHKQVLVILDHGIDGVNIHISFS